MSREEARIELLRHLSLRHSNFLVWKHLDRALDGQGDVDAAAPAADAHPVAADASAVARRVLGATDVIICEHSIDRHLQFFVQPERLPQLFELDICTQPSRGLTPWADPRAMLHLSTTSLEGIRRLRPGAEAVVSLVYYGISLTGRYRLAPNERTLIEVGLRHDLSGAEEACRVLVPNIVGAPLLKLVRAFATGGWDSAGARGVYLAFLAGGSAHPLHALRRTDFRLRHVLGGDCIMGQVTRRNRTVPDGGLDALFRIARKEGHEVQSL